MVCVAQKLSNAINSAKKQIDLLHEQVRGPSDPLYVKLSLCYEPTTSSPAVLLP